LTATPLGGAKVRATPVYSGKTWKTMLVLSHVCF
jgi:hypothetical protein